MSCEIRQIATFTDFQKCQGTLLKERDGKKGEDHENLLQDCCMAISPSGEIIVLARNNNLVVFTSKWDLTEVGDVKIKYSVSWCGNPCLQPGEAITSVLCLPLIPQGQSVHGGADWTCIVVGFSSGALRFYTEAMNQLISETLHDEPVLNIKCNSFRTPKQIFSSSNQDSNELLYVLYKSVICTINGFSLFQTLRGCRNQLARQRASSLGDALHTSVPVDFKKYGFSDQDTITDACFVGQTSINTFDHLVTASVVGGFYSVYRPGPPQTSLIVATGRKPFVGYHYTIEGGGNPILTDVALAVANKIKNSVANTLPGWFGFGGKTNNQQEKQKEQEPAERLACRFGLCDLWRHGDSIVMSPDGKLSAVSDSLGRVTLIDNVTGLAVRLWKGYREAQCGFLEVEEEVPKTKHKRSKSQSSSSSSSRHALFIVIYAPKKGLIEIFVTQQGPRVASFKVSKQGRLLYTPHGFVGFSSPPTKGVNSSQNPIIFFSEEGLTEVVIPFHCALSDSSSKKARDLHVLKKMKTFLKQDDYTNEKLVEEMEKFAKELKTNDVRYQVIEMMCANKNITIESFKAVLSVFVQNLQATVPENLDHMGRSVLIWSEQLERLLSFYEFVHDVNNLPPNYKTVIHSDDEAASLSEALLLPPKEITFIMNFIQHIKNLKGAKKGEIRVAFQEKKTTDLIQFISCFDFELFLSSSHLSSEKNDNTENYLCLKSDLNEEKMRTLGEIIFKGMFHSDEYLTDWRGCVHEVNMDRKNLMECLLTFWLGNNLTGNIAFEIISLLELVRTVCSLMDPKAISVEYNLSSPWWKNIQSVISSSRHVLPGLIAAVCCRAVTIIVEQEKELLKNQSGEKSQLPAVDESGAGPSSAGPESSSSNDWENVSQDTWQWDKLITQLEDVALLNTVLSICPSDHHAKFTKLAHDFEPESLTSILLKGKGRVSELVAKWLTQFGLDPVTLIDSKDVEFQTKPVVDKNDKGLSIGTKDGVLLVVDDAKEVRADNATTVLDHLAVLKKQFPYSLTSSALMCNMGWEYIAYWYKNVEELDCFQMAIDYIKNIPSVRIKYGICYLSWSTYIRSHFESVSKLINKLGKLPKEKLYVQEINLTNLQVPIFFKHTTEFLNILLECSVDKGDDFVSNQEGIWQNDVTAATPSLVSLVLSQPVANDSLLLLHYQLSMSLYMITTLNIKQPKIFSTLFDNLVRQELFSDLTQISQSSSHYYNVKLKSSRQQFLCKAISNAVQTIELVEYIPPLAAASSIDYVPSSKLNVDEATKWLRMCFDLAAMWDIPADDLRRHHVCELYSCGFDRLAEEVLSAVNERNDLASQLLVVAGQRLKVFVHSSTDLTEKISNLSPALTTWFDTLDSENLKNQNTVLNDLSVLLAYILKWLPECHEDLKLAVAMADSIPSLDNNTAEE